MNDDHSSSSSSSMSLDEKDDASTTTLTFSNTLEAIQPTIHKLDYSADEKAATWYDNTELKSFRRERRAAARQMEQGFFSLETDVCTRGVENMTRDGSRQRQVAITQGLSAVLDEQELQDMDGKENPEMLAQIYKLHTIRSQAAAYERGLKDQQAVLDAPVSPGLFQLF